jgi:hypothetical protein
MHYIGDVSALIGIFSGFVSAYYWWASSKVTVHPAWKPETNESIDKNVMSWVTGVMIVLSKSGSLNTRAALWAALAVATSSIANAIFYFSR